MIMILLVTELEKTSIASSDGDSLGVNLPLPKSEDTGSTQEEKGPLKLTAKILSLAALENEK